MKNTIETISITSVGDYLKEASARQAAWEKSNEFQSDAWFRGVPDADYTLSPSFHRFHTKHNRIEEDDLRDEFMRRSYPLFKQGPPTNNWDWYFLMQHYDLPTRLLDWSESSLVGLFFAVYDYRALKAGMIERKTDAIEKWKNVDGGKRKEKKAAVWMMDPETLNKHSLGRHFAKEWPILRHDDEQVEDYLSERPGTLYEWPDKPVAILPPCTNPRLTAQRGMFVLFGSDETPLEKRLKWNTSDGPRLIRFEIPPDAIPDIRSDLRRAGITSALLFPELSMLSNEIIHSWLE